jgi:hypothetical protein
MTLGTPCGILPLMDAPTKIVLFWNRLVGSMKMGTRSAERMSPEVLTFLAYVMITTCKLTLIWQCVKTCTPGEHQIAGKWMFIPLKMVCI